MNVKVARTMIESAGVDEVSPLDADDDSNSCRRSLTKPSKLTLKKWMEGGSQATRIEDGEGKGNGFLPMGRVNHNFE